jgi:hypothetical protein
MVATVWLIDIPTFTHMMDVLGRGRDFWPLGPLGDTERGTPRSPGHRRPRQHRGGDTVPPCPPSFCSRVIKQDLRMRLMRYPKGPLRILSRSINVIFRKRLRAGQGVDAADDRGVLSERKVSLA